MRPGLLESVTQLNSHALACKAAFLFNVKSILHVKNKPFNYIKPNLQKPM